MVRRRDFSSATIGKKIPCANTPRSNSSSEKRAALTPEPMITGVIGVTEPPVLKPSRLSPSLKKRVFSQRRALRSGSVSITSTAAMQAAMTAGGGERDKWGGRDLCVELH